MLPCRPIIHFSEPLYCMKFSGNSALYHRIKPCEKDTLVRGYYIPFVGLLSVTFLTTVDLTEVVTGRKTLGSLS